MPDGSENKCFVVRQFWKEEHPNVFCTFSFVSYFPNIFARRSDRKKNKNIQQETAKLIMSAPLKSKNSTSNSRSSSRISNIKATKRRISFILDRDARGIEPPPPSFLFPHFLLSIVPGDNFPSFGRHIITHVAVECKWSERF